ncbi:WhiB family transcriptional regulator [Nocardioides sp. 31GB23]|uniref:WhiB family transcriptional regulator n=1 Tax=Nocardioides sp. 31GB23 TaxID=3156065 RepID=UPI0032AF82C4
MTTTDPERTAWLALHHQLDVLAQAGRPTPCQVDPDPFTSDERAERQEAALACQPCPARGLCLDYANASAESWHVWGGIDRAPRSHTRKASK